MKWWIGGKALISSYGVRWVGVGLRGDGGRSLFSGADGGGDGGGLRRRLWSSFFVARYTC